MAIDDRSSGGITHDEACQTLFDLLAAHADVDLDIAEAAAIVNAATWTAEATREYAESVEAIRDGYRRLTALHQAMVAPVESPSPALPSRPIAPQAAFGPRLRAACAVPRLKLRPRLLAYPTLQEAYEG